MAIPAIFMGGLPIISDKHLDDLDLNRFEDRYKPHDQVIVIDDGDWILLAAGFREPHNVKILTDWPANTWDKIKAIDDKEIQIYGHHAPSGKTSKSIANTVAESLVAAHQKALSEAVTAAKQDGYKRGRSSSIDESPQVSMKNKRGEYVPAIPEPYFIKKLLRGNWRVKCSCGEVFNSQLSYREHYAYEHIVMGSKPL